VSCECASRQRAVNRGTSISASGSAGDGHECDVTPCLRSVEVAGRCRPSTCSGQRTIFAHSVNIIGRYSAGWCARGVLSSHAEPGAISTGPRADHVVSRKYFDGNRVRARIRRPGGLLACIPPLVHSAAPRASAPPRAGRGERTPKRSSRWIGSSHDAPRLCVPKVARDHSSRFNAHPFLVFPVSQDAK